MINKLKHILLLLIVILSASSCNKWLDLRPEDGIIRQNYWQTKEQLQAAVVGCYASLLEPGLVQSFFNWGELRGDMISVTNFASTDELNVVEGNILPSNSLTDWTEVYQTINYCNTVIDFAPNVKEKDKTLTDLQLNAYLAEAKGIRALMYFYLLRTFGEVPLQLKATSSDVSLQQLAKSSRDDVYKQIMDDLKFAELNSPLTYGNITLDKGRLTRFAILAIEADAYLWMDDYENCLQACDKIINSNQFALVPVVNDAQSNWFSTVFRFGNSQESIFELQFDQQKLNPFYGMFASGSRHFGASARVMEEVYGVDEFDATNKDMRGDGASVKAEDGTISKFAGYYSGTDFKTVSSSISYTHWFMYRYSDILLLKAEALTWLGRGQEALDIIKVIRGQEDPASPGGVTRGVNALPVTEEFPSADDPLGISVYILNERSREFAFEGKRWFDILRVAKRNNYQQIDLIVDMIAKTAPADRQQSMINKYKDVRSHYLPINEYELRTDPNLEQNPFYE